MTISSKDNNNKIWNTNNLECILNLDNINNNGILFSACFLNKNNEIFILTNNSNIGINESIKVFDLNGQKIKEIKILMNQLHILIHIIILNYLIII